ncbi:uncharacterized protein F5147DRAFT_579385 [Suillus discolor]|uniref:G domain-containing protein n=1 Tax=Suillus discolor TaxID=1912936 RepID=A0A9P7JSW8_9AGAM|nr:uncharacterized protein F5147DRAFT_579385 [Suillus discolor]KAG2105514.1 hypothetical protein F5147DRAFT_579385 [Suillus discolor]
MDPSRIREKIGRFRILVIGRENAGKTTILERVCNTRDNPEIYNSAGEKVGITMLVSRCALTSGHELMYSQRGEHDIENEMVFQSNPGFVFHDSCRFKTGSTSKFEMVKAFIASRSKETSITKQLHAIW